MEQVSKYQVGESIGRGAVGVVVRCLDLETGVTVAMKRVLLSFLDSEKLGSIETEIRLLKKLQHPNIVKYIDTIRSKDHLNIVLEYVENGSLQGNLKKYNTNFPEQLVAKYIAQVLQGLHYLHDQGVIHRDIKGANILVTKDGLIKLADFGVATTDANQTASVVGTPYWMAPEIIEMSGYQGSACDIWSVGCTIIELLTGSPPYFDIQPLAALFRIVQDEHPPLPDNISPTLKDFLMSCFQKDPTLRQPASKLLQHSWLKTAMHDTVIDPVIAIPKSISITDSSCFFKPKSKPIIDDDKDPFADIDDDDFGKDFGDADITAPVLKLPQSKSSFSLNQFRESDNNDDWDGDFQETAVDLSQKLKEKKLQLFDEDDDPFRDQDFTERDEKSEALDKITAELAGCIESLQLSAPMERITASISRLNQVYAEDQNLLNKVLNTHGVIPFLEMLESPDSTKLFPVLEFLYTAIRRNKEFEQSLALLGLIPTIINLVNPSYSRSLRLLVADFVRHFCMGNTFIRKMFIACGGLLVLVSYLDCDYFENREFIWKAIDSIRDVFGKGSAPKSDFCRLFCKVGLLNPLVNVFLHLLSDDDHSEDALIYAKKVADLLLLFALQKSEIKSNLVKEPILESLFNSLDQLPQNILPTILKTIKLLTQLRDNASLVILEESGIIPYIMPFFNSPHPDVQNQVLSSMYHLCRWHMKQYVSRQEQAAAHGIIPHLQQIVLEDHPLKHFALPIIHALATSSRATRMEFKKHGGIEFLLHLLKTLEFWQDTALLTIKDWLEADLYRIEFILLQHHNIHKLVSVFKKYQCNSNDTSSFLQSFYSIISKSARLNTAFSYCDEFVVDLTSKLTSTPPPSARHRRLLLNILSQIIKNKEIIEKHGIITVLERVGEVAEFENLNLISQLVRDIIDQC